MKAERTMAKKKEMAEEFTLNTKQLEREREQTGE